MKQVRYSQLGNCLGNGRVVQTATELLLLIAIANLLQTISFIQLFRFLKAFVKHNAHCSVSIIGTVNKHMIRDRTRSPRTILGRLMDGAELAALQSFQPREYTN